jgi:hypothetical protein
LLCKCGTGKLVITNGKKLQSVDTKFLQEKA